MSTTPRAPRYRLILLPVDRSPESSHAAMHTAALAAAFGATVAILGTMDTGGELAFTPAAAARYTHLRAQAQEAIEAASAIVRGATVPLVEHLIMDGVPATMIVETAAELGADLIVLGIGPPFGDDSLQEINETLVAVIRAAPCPVIVIPSPGTARVART